MYTISMLKMSVLILSLTVFTHNIIIVVYTRIESHVKVHVSVNLPQIALILRRHLS